MMLWNIAYEHTTTGIAKTLIGIQTPLYLVCLLLGALSKLKNWSQEFTDSAFIGIDVISKSVFSIILVTGTFESE